MHHETVLIPVAMGDVTSLQSEQSPSGVVRYV